MMPARRRADGVTLVELMVTAAIVGLLMAIAVPSYQSHRLKAGRGIGASCLIEAQQRLESHYARTGAGPPEVTLADVGLGNHCGDGTDYRLSIDSDSLCAARASPGHFALRATPLDSQAGDGVLLLCVSPSIAHPNLRADRQHLRPDAPERPLAGWDFQPGR